MCGSPVAERYAGDIWAFQGFKVKGNARRFRKVDHEKFGKFIGVGKMLGNENEPGEWNRYEIIMVGDHLTLVVNDQKVNECTGCDLEPGKIALQSEGAEIHFRKVELTPMDVEPDKSRSGSE